MSASDGSVTPEDADLHALRGAIAPLRFPLLLAATSWGVLAGVSGAAILHASTTPGGVWQASSDTRVGTLVVNLVAHGAVLVPLQYFLRAAVAGFQSRAEPERLLDLVVLHRQGGWWVAGLVASSLVLAVLIPVLAGI